ncbi:MAG: hypothetical protein QNL66_04630, partial [Burkholderiaceae bacterium]
MNATTQGEAMGLKTGGGFHGQSEVLSVRRAIRSGEFSSHTSGVAGGNVQGNVVILPQSIASDFLRFCQNNRRPCPIIGLSEPGDPMLGAL